MYEDNKTRGAMTAPKAVAIMVEIAKYDKKKFPEPVKVLRFNLYLKEKQGCVKQLLTFSEV